MNGLRFRAAWIVLGFSALFTVISLRLIYLQILCHEKFREEAIAVHYRTLLIPQVRGGIYDTNQRVLAQTIRITDLYVDGLLALQDRSKLADTARILGMDEQQLAAQLRPDRRYLLLRQDLPEDMETALQALAYRPLRLEVRYKRFYPNAHEGSHVLGFTNTVERDYIKDADPIKVEQGVAGTELVMNTLLQGVPGERRVVKDNKQREIAAFRREDIAPHNGLNVMLTLDAGIQHIVEMAADQVIERFHPEGLSIIVLKPSTGEILALANRPTYNPMDRSEWKPEYLKNGAITNLYEPGSTFKIITLAAVLDQKLISLDQQIFCENGKYFYGGYWLRDTSPHGLISIREAFAHSSNIAFAKLGQLLGQDRMYRYVRDMGFGQRSQPVKLALPGEEFGLLRPLKQWSDLSITRIPIGYELSTNHLQMAMAVGAMANGGKLMEPRLIKAVMDDKGRVVQQFMPRVVRQVVRPETAAKVIDAMRAVVEEGTGKEAAVMGFHAAGKTGTSWKHENGGGYQKDYFSSFAGMIPAENPQFVISVVVDAPKDAYYGGKVAAPAFSEIATRVAQLANLAPLPSADAYARRNP